MAAQTTLPADLTGMSLEELSNVEITSVSKRAERLSDAPSSVFVITADDIRRSGATRLGEVLRLAPNLQVAEAYNGGYAITARGFNGTSANKMLVLIDGRSVYTPLFAGVFWDVQDVLLEDVERIEVISGPGGTLWGVNAVNGVINIITRSSQQTQGELAVAGAGDRQDEVALRHGGASGNASYRVYAKHAYLAHTQTASGMDVDDATHFTQAGFRADWALHNADKLVLQGDTYRGRRGQPLPGTIELSGVHFDLGAITTSGGNLLARWEHHLEGWGSLTVQGYYDRTQRTVPPPFSETLDTFDLQLQHQFHPTPANNVVWGAEVRRGMDHVDNSPYIAFLPARLDQTWSSLFAQDEIALRNDLRLTLGARLERNDYTGNEWLPNARLAWKLAPDHLLWAAASRTVRAPSRLDHDTFVPGEPPYLLRGGPGFQAETARVYELGYRGQPTPASSLSATIFHADYDKLRTQEIVFDPLYVYYGNGMQGTVKGIEAWGSYQLTPAWRVHAGYTRLLQDFSLKPGSNDASAVAVAEGANPGRQVLLRSSMDLPRSTTLDVTARYVSALSSPDVPSYLAFDLRCAWKPRPDLELSLTGQNLFGPGHGEFTDESTRTEFQRGIFGAVTARF